MNYYILPNWPAPDNVKAYSTTRHGGFSKPPYDSLNLSLATGDREEIVLKNRQWLYQDLNLKKEPFWLKQEHTNLVVAIDQNVAYKPIIADASFTKDTDCVCAILTADCIPILVCNKQGTIVAAIHAGWKGIAKGIIEASIRALNTDPKNLLVWLGPAIGPNAFQVQQDVVTMFCQQLPACQSAFIKNEDGYLGNIYQLATIRLNKIGITNIYGGEFCTFSQNELFYSHRRDGEKSGRFTSLIWLTSLAQKDPTNFTFSSLDVSNNELPKIIRNKFTNLLFR